MVQEIAKKLIRMGKKEEAQDLYFIPRSEGYQVFMRMRGALYRPFLLRR